MGRSIALSGIHPWKPGVLLWIEIRDGDRREVRYEPTYEDINNLCTQYDFDVDKTYQVIMSRKPDIQGFLFEAEKWREACREEDDTEDEAVDLIAEWKAALKRSCEVCGARPNEFCGPNRHLHMKRIWKDWK